MTEHEDVTEAVRAALDTMDMEALINVYDPETCITAGELRAIGWPIPKTIPDCGWISRGSWKATCDKVSLDGDDLVAEISIGSLEEFQWLEVKFIVPEGTDDA